MAREVTRRQPVSTAVEDVMRQVVENQVRYDTVIREQLSDEMLVKSVAVPLVDVCEVISEVLQVLVQEELVEGPQLFQLRKTNRCPMWNTLKLSRVCPYLVCQGYEKIVEVHQTLLQETIVEVPQAHMVKLIRKVPKPQTRKVPPQQGVKPVIQVRARVVEVPQVTLKEEIVDQPVVEFIELIKKVSRKVLHQSLPQHFESDTCPKRTVIMFDWDDTLCPTSTIRTSRTSLLCLLCPCLREIARAAINLLIAALQFSTEVLIVTNISEGWVQSSCACH